MRSIEEISGNLPAPRGMAIGGAGRVELPLRTSPPSIHLQTKAHHHSTCIRARAVHRAKTTPPSNARARHGGNGGEAHEILSTMMTCCIGDTHSLPSKMGEYWSTPGYGECTTSPPGICVVGSCYFAAPTEVFNSSEEVSKRKTSTETKNEKPLPRECYFSA